MGLEKDEKRVAKKSQLQSQCLSADCFPGVKYSAGVREGKGEPGHLGRLLCVLKPWQETEYPLC